MRRSAFGALSLVVVLLPSSVLGPAAARAQSSTSPAAIVQSLGSALDSIQGRVAAGDQAGARAAFDAFENVWFGIEDTVRGLSGGSYRDIEDGMRTVRDSVYGTLDPSRARDAIASLRGQINAFAATAGVAPLTQAAPVASSAATASAGAASAAASPSIAPAPAPLAASLGADAGPSTEDCARYSGRAALPYFNYAQALAGGSTIPGIPPAQAVTPTYSYGPSPIPGTVAAGPFRPIYPYGPQVGPSLLPFGGRGVGAVNPQFTAPGLINAFQAGGQLPILPNAGLGAAGVPDVIALAGQQAAEAANRIALGDSQQNVVANQLGFSDLRSTWIGTYLSMSEQARDIALSLCGRIPG
jgi:hypothetical protein